MKTTYIFLALFISCAALGQSKEANSMLAEFLHADQLNTTATGSFTSFINKLEKKQLTLKNETDFIRFIFNKTHQQYLKKYETNAPISEVFNSGSYNCLTGTILYAIILDHFKIAHQVIETNYHIFILAETKQGKILFEATDPLNGFVTNEQTIENRINTYKANHLQATSAKTHMYEFNFELFNTVTFEELRGLLYYNKSVDAYNNKDLPSAVYYLYKAHALYSSSRIDEFSQVLLLTLQHSTLDASVRAQCMKTVLSIMQESLPAVASLF